jgi:hypothetical protein
MSLENDGFEKLDKVGFGGPKYPGKPYVSVGKNHIYFSKVAVEMMEFTDNDSLSFAKRGDDFFAYRTEYGASGSFKVNRLFKGPTKYTAIQAQAKSVMSRGLAHGDYILQGPTYAGGVDLFKLVPHGQEAE